MSGPFVSFTGPEHTVQIAGVKLLGVNASNAHKLLFTLIFFLILYLLGKILRFTAQKVGGTRQKTAFWTKQAISLTTVLIGLVGLVSIWFDNPARLATGAGLIGAGVAFALQQVITSFAGYFVILRGKTFNVGDRIVMGNVRGDVIALNLIQTVIMEMGQPPPVQGDDPGMWVRSRQYSGRIVTISNSKIFEEPVYNYTRDFPYFSFIAGGAPAAGWFSYAPLSEKAYSSSQGVDYYSLGLFALGIGSIIAAINLITTIALFRAPGLAIRRLPLFVWMVLVTQILVLLALPALNASLSMLLIDRLLNGHFFVADSGGSALLWQHFFWSSDTRKFISSFCRHSA